MNKSYFLCSTLCAGALIGGLATTSASAGEMSHDEKVAAVTSDQTGTDPRGLSSKFMPYYRYTDYENDLEQHDLTMFGLVNLGSPWWAMTYEVPIAKKIDYKSVDAFKNGGDINPGDGIPSGLPFDSLSSDGSDVGIGDANFRLFYMPPNMTGQNEKGRSHSWIFGFETTIPSASEDVLGGNTWIMSPMFIYVRDTPWNGFVAAMNFYDFHVFKDRSREDISRYRGRWYAMQPLTKPGTKLTDGLYLMPELQPIYDFENEKFSFWAAPEFGKILSKEHVIYVKPGWGIQPGDSDRNYTVEVGYRYFFDKKG